MFRGASGANFGGLWSMDSLGLSPDRMNEFLEVAQRRVLMSGTKSNPTGKRTDGESKAIRAYLDVYAGSNDG